ncbi:MAG: hypothetical protein ACR2NH_07675 [Solirubrobacteraceae bacterium]
MSDRAHLDELLDSLLWEGYALYPYTPGATKNATPTPFGIVYPPAYGAEQSAAFDHLQLQCVLGGGDDAELSVKAVFLQATGDRHKGDAHEIVLTGAPSEEPFDFDGLRGAVSVTLIPLEDGRRRVSVRVENHTDVPPGLDRAHALRHSLLSTHVVVQAPRGRFTSPLENKDPAVAGCENANTFPVLATEADDAILGASIVLPDHPQIAPESRGSLFDGTEIEEALLLHVHTLSDAERAEIAAEDPKVAEMIERAAATTPKEIMSLHGRMEMHDKPPARIQRDDSRLPPDPREGEREAIVDGVMYRRGDKVTLRPGQGGDPYDMMLDGRTATVERIYRDTNDKVYLAVTVDGDAAQELLRDSGRYLFFFPPEVEVPA